MKLTLIKKIQESKDIYTFVFEPETPITWKAGQHIFLKIPHENPDARGEIRHFTISSAPLEKDLCITPYRSILMDLAKEGRLPDVILFYCGKAEGFIFTGILDEIKNKYERLLVHFVIEPQLINGEIIKEKAPDLKDRIFYISGPMVMVKIVEEILLKLNIGKSNIVKDYFPGYD